MSRGARRKRLLAWITLAALTVIAGGLLYCFCVVRSIAAHLPAVTNIADLHLSTVTTIESSDGVLLATLQTQYRRPVALKEMSPFVTEATLATEDSRFYQHSGVDFRAIGRAVVANMRHRNAFGQGASTITQQLARNLYLSQDKSYRRKIVEILLARKIEASYSKREILEAYLNTTYYGNGCYGVEAASRAYFGKPAKQLTLGESALLAGVPQRPSLYEPVGHRATALARRDVVLARLVATGQITPAQERQAKAGPLHILRPRLETSADWRAPYFVNHVIAEVSQRQGREFLYSGARIITTLNWSQQQAAERALHRGLRRGWGPTTGALVSIDPHTGYVRALVGGADFRQDQFDAVTMGIRQPGSAFKPFVYAAAFDTNSCNLITTLQDEKLTYSQPPKTWVVHNYDDHYRGTVSVLEAIRQSINTIAVQVAEQTNPATIVYYAQRLGITTPLQANLPLALGASGVHPLDICSAFSAFANHGDRYTPTFVIRVIDARGQEVSQDDPTSRYHANFLNPTTLDQINVALREVVLHGTGAAAASIPDAHGKTGTTSSHRDAWFIGYTSDLATAVWVARARREKPLQVGGHTVVATDYLPMAGATGGALCAPIWRDFMAAAVPIQQHVNRVYGLPEAPVAAPDKATLIASLQQTGEETTLGQRAAEKTPNPPQNEPALYGSPPITVLVPEPEDSGDDTTVSQSDDQRREESYEEYVQERDAADAQQPRGPRDRHRDRRHRSSDQDTWNGYRNSEDDADGRRNEEKGLRELMREKW